MRIGQLADVVGISTKAVRYYESIGLLEEPERTSSGYRDYASPAIARLTFIRDAQAAGLSLAEIGSVITIKNEGGTSCGHTLDLLEGHIADLGVQISRLEAARAQLRDLADRGRGLDPSTCTDPHRCQVIVDTTSG